VLAPNVLYINKVLMHNPGLLLSSNINVTHLLSVTSPAMPGSCLTFAVATIPSSPLLLAVEVITGGIGTATVDLVVTATLL